MNKVVYDRFARTYKIEGMGNEEFKTRAEAEAAVKRKKIEARWGEKQQAGGTVAVVLTKAQYEWVCSVAQSRCIRLSTLMREIVQEAMEHDNER